MYRFTDMRTLRADVWHIGDVLRKLREARHWTRKRLAEKADVRPNTIGAWEDGSVEPDPKTLRKVAHALEVRVEFLLANIPVPPTAEVPPAISPRDDQERALLEKLRTLSEEQRASLMHIVHGMQPEGAARPERDGTHDQRADATTPDRAERKA